MEQDIETHLQLEVHYKSYYKHSKFAHLIVRKF